jgi:hypothetical protein
LEGPDMEGTGFGGEAGGGAKRWAPTATLCILEDDLGQQHRPPQGFPGWPLLLRSYRYLPACWTPASSVWCDITVGIGVCYLESQVVSVDHGHKGAEALCAYN